MCCLGSKQSANQHTMWEVFIENRGQEACKFQFFT
jgi:hypothetical protein